MLAILAKRAGRKEGSLLARILTIEVLHAKRQQAAN
jgi:hypothetical protein